MSSSFTTLEKFEEISYLLKNRATLKKEDFINVEEFKQYKDIHKHYSQWVSDAKKLFEVKRAYNNKG
jgi:hypothetical protein